MLMVTPRTEMGKERVLFFADCGVVPDPDPARLADIAIPTADNSAPFLAASAARGLALVLDPGQC